MLATLNFFLNNILISEPVWQKTNIGTPSTKKRKKETEESNSVTIIPHKATRG